MKTTVTVFIVSHLWGAVQGCHRNSVVVLGTRRVQSLTGIEIRNWKMAQNLSDMRVPPGNRLEALSGDRKGQWSISINGQYRICFRWIDDNPMYVEIVDYH